MGTPYMCSKSQCQLWAERVRERESREERAAKAAHEREAARAHAARESALHEQVQSSFWLQS